MTLMNPNPEVQTENDNLILLCGKSATGKSASLMGIKNIKGVMYLNCEAGKKPPFRSRMQEYTITEPNQIKEAFEVADKDPSIHTIVVDSLTYLMEMYISLYVLDAPQKERFSAWANYAEYFRDLMQQYVAPSTKNVVFIAHVADVQNESDRVLETAVPVSGQLKKNGLESWFSCVIASKKVRTKELSKYENDMLNITAQEEALGYKYVFQTQLTADTVNERLRHPLRMWDEQETYIDNNLQLVFNRLKDYYADDEDDVTDGDVDDDWNDAVPF